MWENKVDGRSTFFRTSVSVSLFLRLYTDQVAHAILFPFSRLCKTIISISKDYFCFWFYVSDFFPLCTTINTWYVHFHFISLMKD